MEEILIPIAMFAMIFGIVYITATIRNRERMALIEKGADPKLFSSQKKYGALRFGMLAVGVAIGLLIGNMLATNTTLDEEIAHFSMILLFGGSGLIASHFIVRRMKESEKDDE